MRLTALTNAVVMVFLLHNVPQVITSRTGWRGKFKQKTQCVCVTRYNQGNEQQTLACPKTPTVFSLVKPILHDRHGSAPITL